MRLPLKVLFRLHITWKTTFDLRGIHKSSVDFGIKGETFLTKMARLVSYRHESFLLAQALSCISSSNPIGLASCQVLTGE